MLHELFTQLHIHTLFLDMMLADLAGHELFLGREPECAPSGNGFLPRLEG